MPLLLMTSTGFSEPSAESTKRDLRRNAAQPVVSIPEAPQTATDPLSDAEGAPKSNGGLALDFLSSGDASVLSRPEPSVPEASKQAPLLLPKETAAAPELAKTFKRFKEKGARIWVTFPISESCSAEEAGPVCRRVFSDGTSSELKTETEWRGQEFRKMTTILEYSPGRELIETKTIYQGTQYRAGSKERKEFEFFEISYTPLKGPQIKEILIYDFHETTDRIKKITWGQYEQQNPDEEALLVAHAFLTYDEHGTPDKGLAENLEEGYLTAQFLNGKDPDPATVQLSRDAWRGWENWISSRPMSAYLS